MLQPHPADRSQSASLQTERVWNEPLPSLNVTYRNVTKVYFRAVAYNFESYLTGQRWQLYNFDDKQRKQILAKSPALEWNADLPATTDSGSASRTAGAEGTQARLYFIVASHDPSFGETKQPSQRRAGLGERFRLGDAATTIRRRGRSFRPEGSSGEPVANAVCKSGHGATRVGLSPANRKTQIENGLVRFRDLQGVNDVRRDAGRQQIATAQESYFYNQRLRLLTRGLFLPDRSLYRPGKRFTTREFHSLRSSANNYAPLADLQLNIVFLDPNGKEVARETKRCNDYGSFDGAFTAPRDRVMGRMQIVWKVVRVLPLSTSRNTNARNSKSN